MSACPTCGWPTFAAQDVVDGRARYADTQGGHNDRHTLIVEAAEQTLNPGRLSSCCVNVGTPECSCSDPTTAPVAGQRVHNHPPYRPPCAEREVDGQLRGACLNDDGTDRS